MADKPWTDMTADERRAWRIDAWRNPSIPFASAQAEADYKARVDRMLAASELRKPDRVPVHINTGWWPAIWAGMTPYEAMNDPARSAQAWVDFTLEFPSDSIASPLMYTAPAQMFELIDYKLYSWPGHGVAKDASYQYNEKEWMLPEEYDHLISDPSDYILRAYLPRILGSFAGFANLSSLFDFTELPFVAGQVGAWGTPEMADGLEKIATAARHVANWGQATFPKLGELMALGFPNFYGGATKAPFDILGDTLRGTRAMVLDLYRRPEKVLAACDRLVQVAIDWALKRPTPPTPLIFMPLHKGADGFMSDEQFRTFYWPSLRAVVLGLIEEGCIPFLFAEGHFGSRLEAIMDLPKGRTIWLFDQTDMTKAKQTIGKVACIEGNVPLSLIYAGTPEETTQYSRTLIESAGEGGGFILDIGAVADSGKPENLRAMLKAAEKYGRY
jgi:hypothetical protein